MSTREPIVYVDASDIRDGCVEKVKACITELVEFVEANEPQLISYGFFLDTDETRMTVVAVHPDSASLEFHMDVAGPGFRKFTGLIDLLTIDVYGEISEEALVRLQQKAAMLGQGTVRVHHRHGGFVRSGAEDPGI